MPIAQMHAPTLSVVETRATAERAVTFEGVAMTYRPEDPPAKYIIAGLSLEISKGEFFVLVGPSGSGKSSLLKLIAGTAFPREGRVLDESGQPVTGPDRKRGMVFQSMETPLFNWLTVADNVAFGLKMAGMAKAERRVKAQSYIELVGLKGHEHKYPHELSGGMKQRVQIARTLATGPDIVLMDEPFAALDAMTRRVLQREIARIWAETRKTFIYVTHDIREALLLGERVAVMSSGPRATIRSIHEISLSFPRDDLDARFADLVRKLDAEIEQEAKNQWAGV